MFYTEDPQILGAAVQNLVVAASWLRDLCTPELRIVTALRITECEALRCFLSVVRTGSLSDTVHCTQQDCNAKRVCDVLQVRTGAT